MSVANPTFGFPGPFDTEKHTNIPHLKAVYARALKGFYARLFMLMMGYLDLTPGSFFPLQHTVTAGYSHAKKL